MRNLLDVFDRAFSATGLRSAQLLEKISDEELYRRPRELPQTFAMFSVGEYVLRSAAAVEQTFGGITTRLWDDPFEWTLPEKLNSVGLVRHYLDEVETTRIEGFRFFNSDDDLSKELPAPVEIKAISQILIETLARAEHFQGRAYAVFQMISDTRLPMI